MLPSHWFGRLGTSRKEFWVVFILLFNAFTWYYMTILVIDSYLKVFSLTSTDALTMWITYYLSVTTSSIVGVFISKVRKSKFFFTWMLLGTVTSLLPAVSYIPPHVWSLALGFSLGLGMPACLAYFADYSTVENRGSISGVVFLTFSLSAALLALLFTQLNLAIGTVLFALWRAIGLVAIAILKPKETVGTEKRKQISFVSILKDRTLRLYLIPWIMFILIDRFEWSLWGRNLDPSLNTVTVAGPIIGSFAALVGGYLSDKVGRKRVVISGFVALGLAYAVIGVAPDMLISWYLYIAVDGAAWGILLVTLLLTLWGDISQVGNREKFYVIGATPYYFTSIIEIVLTSYVLEIPAYAAFSLASFFLFIAVIPLLFAPETLPEKKIEIRRLKGYVEQARKIREKYAPS